MTTHDFKNPFKPGAGHMPPYLAGRNKESKDFERMLDQETILENLVLTGLRGVGKTVLLDSFKPMAIAKGWMWAGTDLSESSSLSDERIAKRLITDLALVTSSITILEDHGKTMGFHPLTIENSQTLNYEYLNNIYDGTPGMPADKLKAVLEFAWDCLKQAKGRGVVFAYDEAQNLSDHAAKDEYPLSLLLDVFQSIQKKNIPFMLALTGLPTLFPKLVEARTFSERMFHVVFLDRLAKKDSADAIRKPIEDTNCPVVLDNSLVDRMIAISGGYPYFIQFLGREAYDFAILHITRFGSPKAGSKIRLPFDDIVRKLDNDFFMGRWSRATDRQRVLLYVVAQLPHCDEEYSVQDIVEMSKSILENPFGASHVNQMLSKLSDSGLIYKNRHGRYSFAVPLMHSFIKRQSKPKDTEKPK